MRTSKRRPIYTKTSSELTTRASLWAVNRPNQTHDDTPSCPCQLYPRTRISGRHLNGTRDRASSHPTNSLKQTTMTDKWVSRYKVGGNKNQIKSTLLGYVCQCTLKRNDGGKHPDHNSSLRGKPCTLSRPQKPSHNKMCNFSSNVLHISSTCYSPIPQTMSLHLRLCRLSIPKPQPSPSRSRTVVSHAYPDDSRSGIGAPDQH